MKNGSSDLREIADLLDTISNAEANCIGISIVGALDVFNTDGEALGTISWDEDDAFWGFE